MEQAITLLIYEQPSVSYVDIQEALARNEYSVSQEELDRAIGGLRLYSILLKEGKRYRLASEVFGQIVRESQEVDILLTSLRKQMQYAPVEAGAVPQVVGEPEA